MIVYAESSAVLGWLFGESHSGMIREHLTAAEFVLTSELTLVECFRAFHRAQSLGALSPDLVAGHRQALERAADEWVLLRMSEEVLERSKQPFPVEPIRSLDALHVATALAAGTWVKNLALLTLDDRVRRCGAALGFRLLPADS